MPYPLLKANLQLYAFALRYIPLIRFCRPRIVALSPSELCVAMKLTRRNKNHLGSMYLGALTVGADIAAGFLAFELTRSHSKRIKLAFKSMKAEFFQRADSEVYFHCKEGSKIAQMLQQSQQQQKRINDTIEVLARCPSTHGEAIMARFEMGLSIKLSDA